MGRLPLPRDARDGQRIPLHIHMMALGCALLVVLALFALPAEDADATLPALPSLADDAAAPPADGASFVLPLPDDTSLLPQPAASAATEARVGDDDAWRSAVVRPGDSLSQIFSRLGLNADSLYSLMSSDSEAQQLTRVRPGELFRVRTDGEGSLVELVYEPDPLRGLRALRSGNAFAISQYEHKVEKRTAYKAGSIQNSLYRSAQDAGLSDRTIIRLTEIFGWDIDFALDIRKGDRFAVVYEEDYLAGEYIGDGDILAAEFVNQGKTYRAVRHTTSEGATHYYNGKGEGMRQAFLRAPVDFRRISSQFQRERYHPVLGVKRPHRGTDYAAATGTPIWASGDGVVEFAGVKGGYGNTIEIRHGKRYTTLYAHLSRFAKGLRRGQRVTQGEVIGYVGSSGVATGPHLHYEFRVDGTHVDPVKVKLPGAEPLPKREMARFLRVAEPLLTQLDVMGRTAVALGSGK